MVLLVLRSSALFPIPISKVAHTRRESLPRASLSPAITLSDHLYRRQLPDCIMGMWSKLPVDLLNLVEEHFVLYEDKIRIRSVCVDWNSYLPKLPNHQAKHLPWLFYPLPNNPEASHGLFNPIDGKIYNIYLPEARLKVFKGSSYGWVVTFGDFKSSSPADICLINPLTRDCITLPPRSEFDDVVEYRPNKVGDEFVVRYFFDDSTPSYHLLAHAHKEVTTSTYFACLNFTLKVILTSAPCDDECVVVAIYGNTCYLAWCRVNDIKWTHYKGISWVVDMIFEKGKLYVLDRYGDIHMVENIGSVDSRATKITSGVPIIRGKSVYLAVRSDGSLLVVNRYFDFDPTVRTVGFKVFKLDILDSTLVELKDIDGDVLFLGSYTSTRLISSQHVQGLQVFKGNCIYFSDWAGLSRSPEVNKNKGSDSGVFNLMNGTLEPLPCLHQPVWPRPTWLNVC